jgi:hypothetical protein
MIFVNQAILRASQGMFLFSSRYEQFDSSAVTPRNYTKLTLAISRPAYLHNARKSGLIVKAGSLCALRSRRSEFT